MTTNGTRKAYLKVGTTKPAFNGPRNPEEPATERAIGYLRNLGHEREVGMSIEDFDIMLDVWIEAKITTAGFVSDQINEYKDRPKRPVKETEPGYYAKDGHYYAVVLNKAKTHTYAKELIVTEGKASWEYKPGAVRALGALTPLTIEEAAKWGHLHGHCIVCCRPLTDPASVTNGIGPVCAKRLKA